MASCLGDVVANICGAVTYTAWQKENAEKKQMLQELQVAQLTLAQMQSKQKESQAEIAATLAEAKKARDASNLQARKLLSQSNDNVANIVSQTFARQTSSGAECITGQMTEEELGAHFDIVIIGGGPVGIAAAIKCACLGHRAIIVDKPKVAPRQSDGLDVSFGGPTGLYSKALRDTAKHVDVPSLQSMHLDDEVIWHQVQNMCMHLAESNASHQVKALKNFKIDYLQATATVISATNVLVQRANEPPAVLATDHVLLATGSKPMRPLDIPFDDVRVFDSDTINNLQFLPKSVAIVGSGIIAIEYAKIFRKLGVKVSMLVRSGVLNALERIGLDTDIAKKLIDVLHDDDVTIYEGTTVEDFDVPLLRSERLMTLKLKSSNPEVPSTLKVDLFLAAAGRVPNTVGWGCEKLGLKIAKRGGHVETDERYETSCPGIFAAGDIIGPPALASTGAYQAQQAVLEVFGEGHMNKYKSFPVGMWTTPECGYYGLTLAAAKKEGFDAQEGCVDYSACLRGRVFAPVGLLKIVFNVDDGKILGVHILGEDACELVHYGMDLVCQGVTIFQVMTTCFTAVTFHELFKEAALDGNSKLEFGLEWHKVLNDIGVHMDNHEHGVDLPKIKVFFDNADADGNGVVDESELMDMFKQYGCEVSRATVHNLVRLVDETNCGGVHWDEFSKVFDILDKVRSNSHFGGKEGSAKTEAKKQEVVPKVAVQVPDAKAAALPQPQKVAAEAAALQMPANRAAPVVKLQPAAVVLPAAGTAVPPARR